MCWLQSATKIRHVLAMHTVHGFLQISKFVTCQSRGVSKIGDFIQIIFVLVSAWNATLNYKWIIGCLTLISTMHQLYFSVKKTWVACLGGCGGSWICKYMYNQCASPLNYKRCEFESRWWRGVFDTTLCDEVCQWLLTSWWFSQTWSHNVVSVHLAMKGARTDNLDMHWLHRYILIQLPCDHSHDGPLCHWQTWSHIYTIYIHCQKIYNLFVQALERDVMGAFGKFVWSAL